MGSNSALLKFISSFVINLFFVFKTPLESTKYPYLLSDNLKLAACCSPGELVSLLHLGRKLAEVVLVLLPGLVGVHQLETIGAAVSFYQVHSSLEIWCLRVEHNQLSLLETSVISVGHYE